MQQRETSFSQEMRTGTGRRKVGTRQAKEKGTNVLGGKQGGAKEK
jgi:hypothetical protein